MAVLSAVSGHHGAIPCPGGGGGCREMARQIASAPQELLPQSCGLTLVPVAGVAISAAASGVIRTLIRSLSPTSVFVLSLRAMLAHDMAGRRGLRATQ
jgi:hypothetical protein